MKERPILFSAPMVRAILDGRKTQTRRVFKDKDAKCIGGRDLVHVLCGEETSVLTVRQPADTAYAGFSYPTSGTMDPVYFKCPYGQPGDRLWARESFQPLFADGRSFGDTNYETGDGYNISYPASDGIKEFVDIDDNMSSRCWPSIHMPRWASRITLEITDIRVERLNDISEENARAEGVGHGFQMNAGWPDYQHIKNGVCELTQDTAEMSFASLWESINGPGSWVDNPWVWVIEFKRVTP